MAWNISSVSLSQLSQPWPLAGPRPPPAYLLWGQSRKQGKWPEHCASTAQQQLKHPRVPYVVLATCIKHSTIQTAIKKINSIPARPSDIWYCTLVPCTPLKVHSPGFLRYEGLTHAGCEVHFIVQLIFCNETVCLLTF